MVARWEVLAAEKLLLVLTAFAQDHRKVAGWAFGSLIDEDDSFAGCSSESSSPIADHVEGGAPTFYLSSLVVEYGNVDVAFFDLSADFYFEAGSHVYAEPPIALYLIPFLHVVRWQIVGDSEVEIVYFGRRALRLGTEWRGWRSARG